MTTNNPIRRGDKVEVSDDNVTWTESTFRHYDPMMWKKYYTEDNGKIDCHHFIRFDSDRSHPLRHQPLNPSSW